MNGSKNRSHLIYFTDNHMMSTHTHHKATCCTLIPPIHLQTVPQAAHKMRHRLKMKGVMSTELKSEKIF